MFVVVGRSMGRVGDRKECSVTWTLRSFLSVVTDTQYLATENRLDKTLKANDLRTDLH